MKMSHNQAPEAGEHGQVTKANNSMLSKKENEKKNRRKSGRFLGLSLKPFTKDTSGKHEDEVKTSLLKRLGSGRSSKKKNKRDKDLERSTSKKTTSGSSSSQDGTDSTVTSISDELNSDGAGHTPKTRRLKKVSAKQVHSILGKSIQETDSGGEEESIQGRSAKSLASQKTKQPSKHLKRSISLICGSSRSKYTEVKVTDDVLPIPRKAKGRRSLGTGILSGKTKSKITVEKENEQLLQLSTQGETDNLKNSYATPKKNDVYDENIILDKIDSSLRRKSFGGLNVSTKKAKPKRQSYDRMNKERDGVLSLKKSALSEDTEPLSPCSYRGLRRKWSSFKLMSNLTKTGNTFESGDNDKVPFLDVPDARPSPRRKSMGGITPRNRRGSGIYSSIATPTFMTCGFVMTDSPPNTPPELSADMKRTKTKHSNSAITRPGTVPIIPLDNIGDDLPWVVRKRKRRSELIDRSQVNRCKAGHTPLPPRKKRKSYDERFIH